MAFTGNYACNTFKAGLPSGTFAINTSSSNLYISLYTNEATLNADTAGYTSVGQVPNTTGYTAGGQALVVTVNPTTGTSTTAYFSFANATWSSALTARGALIYLRDNVTNPAICVLDFGADKTSTTTFTVQFPTADSNSAIIRIS
jgi:hypothetical protein